MKRRALHNWILAADLPWLAFTYWFAESRIHRHDGLYANFFFEKSAALLVLAWLLWTLQSRSVSLDGFRKGWRFSAVVSRLLLSISFLSLALLAISSASGTPLTLRSAYFFGFFFFLGCCCIRLITRRLLQHPWRPSHRVAILGSGHAARKLAGRLHEHPELFCKVVGILRPEQDLAETSSEIVSEFPASIPTVAVSELLQQRQIDELILLHNVNSMEVVNLAAQCRAAGIRVSLVPYPYEPYLSRLNLLDLNGIPLLRTHAIAASPLTRAGKRTLDLLLGGALTIVAMPALLFSALILRWTTGRAFRWETRIGWHGQQFSMLRLNIERDPQNGSFFQWLLWHLSISELPQLWNIFCGEMSLVGPRPEGPERTRHYSPWQEQRLSARPGITGLAQVQGLREQSASEEKTEFDLQYLARPSLFHDLSLLLETVWIVIARLFRLPRLLFIHRSMYRQPQGPSAFAGYPLQEEIRAHRAQSGSD